MSSAPGDLLTLRSGIMAECGFSNPVEVGIVADEDHLSNGGYHCGCADINSIGKYNSATKDYSVRQSRDRLGTGSNIASAMDIGDDWPRGGRAAWLRFNQILRAQLGARDASLAAVRAINYLNGAGQKRRFDTLTMTETSTTDTVDIHTHVEWWRNTNGTTGRSASVTRLLAIVRAARDNTSLAAPPAAKREAETMTLYQVTGVPPAPNNKDYFGSIIPEFGVCQTTMHGPVNLNAAEWASIDQNAPSLIVTPWARLIGRCNAMKPDPIDPVVLAGLIADQFPDESVTTATVLAALQTPEGQAAIATGTTSGLQSTGGQAAIVAADEYSQDH